MPQSAELQSVEASASTEVYATWLVNEFLQIQKISSHKAFLDFKPKDKETVPEGQGAL